jgi:hypothetical protein
MPRRLLRLAFCLSPFAMANVAVAQAPFCFVEHVTQVGRDVELHFVPENGLFVRIGKVAQGVAPTDRIYQQLGSQMHRVFPDKAQPESAISQLILSDGEEASVGGEPHSSCTIRLANEGKVFGVMMKATVSMDGIPPQVTSQFLPVRKRESATQ